MLGSLNASLGMKTWKIQPQNLLVAKYVDCYWFIDKSSGDTGQDSPKLNPAPAAHLIISDSQHPYKYQHGFHADTGYGGHLILPHVKTMMMEHSKPFHIFGIKFQVGAPYALKLPGIEGQLDQIIDIDESELFNFSAFVELEAMANTEAAPESCRDFLDDKLSRTFSDIDDNFEYEQVLNALAIFPETPIADMGRQLACSQRTIERRFLRVTGLTLKQYQTIERLECMLAYLQKLDATEINWADLALQFGFSDQSHLVRVLKNSIGNTPGKYAQLRDLSIDAYGDFK